MKNSPGDSTSTSVVPASSSVCCKRIFYVLQSGLNIQHPADEAYKEVRRLRKSPTETVCEIVLVLTEQVKYALHSPTG